MRKNQIENLELKNTITQMKNTVDSLYRRLDWTEERISEVEDMSVEKIQNDVQEDKIQKRG